MDDVVESIRANWTWLMPPPKRVYGANKFGNVLVAVDDGSIWRICPEELSSTRIASDPVELDLLMRDPEFLVDWQMDALVVQAEASLGVQADEDDRSKIRPLASSGRRSWRRASLLLHWQRQPVP